MADPNHCIIGSYGAAAAVDFDISLQNYAVSPIGAQESLGEIAVNSDISGFEQKVLIIISPAGQDKEGNGQDETGYQLAKTAWATYEAVNDAFQYR